MADIYIHSSLTRFTENKQIIAVSVNTVDELIPALCERYPRLSSSIMTNEGELTPYVNCYINGENITTYDPKSMLMANAKIDLVAALVGG